MLVAALSAVLLAEPAALGEPQDVGGCRVTLLQLSELSESDRVLADGRQAPSGRRLWWLVEPREGSLEPPTTGAVKLTLGGKPYHQVGSPTSARLYAPDVVVRSYADAAGLVPAPRLPPRDAAVVVEVIMRSSRTVAKTATGVAELELKGPKHTLRARARTY